MVGKIGEEAVIIGTVESFGMEALPAGVGGYIFIDLAGWALEVEGNAVGGEYDLANLGLSVSFSSPTTGENFDNYLDFTNTPITSNGTTDLTITPITNFNRTTKVTVTITDDGNETDVEEFIITI